MRAAAALGVAIVALHGAAFVVAARRAQGTELAVTLDAPLAAPQLALGGDVPAALADRVAIDDTASLGPGLAHRRWTTRYRGGYERSVGATQLVGPTQDPDHPACTARVVIGQRLLDDGHAGPGTLAAVVARALDAELRGTTITGAGDYVRVSAVALRWARGGGDGGGDAWVGDAPLGYARATATIELQRVDVPVTIALVPELPPGGAELHVRVAARAELAFDNRVAQWLSDHLGGDRLATRLTRRQLDGALLTVLAPPPPFALPGGGQVRFVPCGAPPEIVDGAYAALPFGVAIGRVAGAPAILPPRLGPGPRPAPTPETRVALDLDVDALDALLFELWRAGELDRQLAEAGLDRRFNADPLVTELLSIRLSPLRLALPPVVRAGPEGLRLAADVRVAIADGAGPPTVGRLYGELGFSFGAPGHAALAPAVTLAGLELACEGPGAPVAPVALVPCYADLVAAMRDRGDQVQGALTLALGGLLSELFIGRRLGDPSLPGELAIHGVAASLARAPGAATLHLELAADVEPVAGR